jgi:hypothetical protein
MRRCADVVRTERPNRASRPTRARGLGAVQPLEGAEVDREAQFGGVQRHRVAIIVRARGAQGPAACTRAQGDIVRKDVIIANVQRSGPRQRNQQRTVDVVGPPKDAHAKCAPKDRTATWTRRHRRDGEAHFALSWNTSTPRPAGNVIARRFCAPLAASYRSRSSGAPSRPCLPFGASRAPAAPGERHVLARTGGWPLDARHLCKPGVSAGLGAAAARTGALRRLGIQPATELS